MIQLRPLAARDDEVSAIAVILMFPRMAGQIVGPRPAGVAV